MFIFVSKTRSFSTTKSFGAYQLFSTLRSSGQVTGEAQVVRPRVDDDAISVAPMMDYTDRNFRYLVRLISKRTKVIV
jgi:hypothetical protein